jgi:hypothetical protein
MLQPRESVEEATMGTLAKIVCLGFGAFYVLGLALFFLAPAVRKLLRGRLTYEDRHRANRKE